MIAAANKIRNKPYVWGGGHGNWNDKGYDCSGAVSYALHGGASAQDAARLDRPLPLRREAARVVDHASTATRATPT